MPLKWVFFKLLKKNESHENRDFRFIEEGGGVVAHLEPRVSALKCRVPEDTYSRQNSLPHVECSGYYPPRVFTVNTRRQDFHITSEYTSCNGRILLSLSSEPVRHVRS